MMTEFLTYDLKVAVLLAAFYFCYRLLMERDTTHRLNRAVLLMMLALSVVLPLCIITLHETVWIEIQPMPAELPTGTAVMRQQPAPADVKGLLTNALGWIIVAGMAARTAYLLYTYWQLRRMIACCEHHTLSDGTPIAVSDEPVAPFSWMNTIVVNRHDYEEHNSLLIEHERSHIRMRHSRDVVFVGALTVLQWFNPVVWLLSRDLRTVHEYEADEAVLSHGVDKAQYLSLLMTKATGIQACVLANGINTSELKKRIDMMMKRKSPRLSWLKALYLVPIVALSLAATAETVTDYKTKQPQKKVVVKKGRKNGQVKINGTTVVKINGTADEAKEEKKEQQAQKPFALHAVVNEQGRIMGFSHEGEPTNPNLVFPLGYIYVDGHEATPEEALQYHSYVWYDIVKSAEGSEKWDYKDKQGIVNFSMKTENSKEDKVYNVCEQLPQFPGGVVELQKWLAMNLKYPADALRWGVTGRYLVQFIVEKDGTLSNAKIVRGKAKEQDGTTIVGFSMGMDELEGPEGEAKVQGVKAGIQAIENECLRLISAMPQWSPGQQNGKPVRVKFTLPVNFRLQ